MLITLRETNVQTVGLPMHVTYRLASQIILLMKMGYVEQLTLTGIYMEYQSQTKCLTLQTKYEQPPRLETAVSPILFLMEKSRQAKKGGLGENIRALTSITIIAIYLSLSKAMRTVRRLRSHY
jgi:hypothetical protein